MKEVVLSFRADLYLMPDAQLFANGAVQKTSFTTDGALQIRDATGQTIFMLPAARVFEQSKPNNNTAVRYHLMPQADGRWTWLRRGRGGPIRRAPIQSCLIRSCKFYRA